MSLIDNRAFSFYAYNKSTFSHRKIQKNGEQLFPVMI